MLRIIIACGGTGGHLFPGIAVAEALKARGHQTLLLISEKEIDTVAARDHAHLQFQRLPAIGLPKLFSPQIVTFAFQFWRTLRQTKQIVSSFKADAVLGMGGFTSLPPAIAGRKLGARTFIHESNAIPGKANRLTAKFCDTVLLGLADCASCFPGAKTQVVGTPLRESLLRPVDRAEAYSFFQLDPAKTTLLVMGGSQGARGVNRSVIDALPQLDPARVQLIFLTGRDDEASGREAVQKAGFQAFVAAFSPRLDLAYALADLCVARSGASSLAELSHFGIPSILIPYPHAAEDHQTRNAEVYSRQSAAIQVAESELAGGRLAPILSRLLDSPDERTALSAHCRALGVPDAAQVIAQVIEQACAPAAKSA